MVLLSAEGVVYQFETTRRVLSGSIVWGQLHGHSTNTSALGIGDPAPSRYYITMIVTSLLMAAIIAGNALIRYRRWRLAKQ
jgi:hypothetical protein